MILILLSCNHVSVSPVSAAFSLSNLETHLEDLNASIPGYCAISAERGEAVGVLVLPDITVTNKSNVAISLSPPFDTAEERAALAAEGQGTLIDIGTIDGILLPGDSAEAFASAIVTCVDVDDPHLPDIGKYHARIVYDVFVCKQSAHDVEKYGICDLPIEPDYQNEGDRATVIIND